MNKDATKWAKKFDQVKHIPTNDSRGVECGKYGALLGNNYATESMPICQECSHVAEINSLRTYRVECIENGERFHFELVSSNTGQQLKDEASGEASTWGAECISMKEITL